MCTRTIRRALMLVHYCLLPLRVLAENSYERAWERFFNWFENISARQNDGLAGIPARAALMIIRLVFMLYHVSLSVVLVTFVIWAYYGWEFLLSQHTTVLAHAILYSVAYCLFIVFFSLTLITGIILAGFYEYLWSSILFGQKKHYRSNLTIVVLFDPILFVLHIVVRLIAYVLLLPFEYCPLSPYRILWEWFHPYRAQRRSVRTAMRQASRSDPESRQALTAKARALLEELDQLWISGVQAKVDIRQKQNASNAAAILAQTQQHISDQREAIDSALKDGPA